MCAEILYGEHLVKKETNSDVEGNRCKEKPKLN